MAAAKRSLGRGLGALIQDKPSSTTDATRHGVSGIPRIPIDSIQKSEWQPRREFDEDALSDLANSISQRGVLQPLLVRPKGDQYELIAGERRLRAAAKAGLNDVPVIVMDAADSESLLIALIENVQREDLNVIEEAEGYALLAEQFDLTQEQISQRVGKARASVTNALRLLALPANVKAMVIAGSISAGHAKVLLALSTKKDQTAYAQRCVDEQLSVRDVEKLIQQSLQPPKKPRTARPDMPASHVAHLSDKLHEHFGTSIRIKSCTTLANGKKARGSIEIDFYSNEDLDRILQLLGIRED